MHDTANGGKSIVQRAMRMTMNPKGGLKQQLFGQFGAKDRGQRIVFKLRRSRVLMRVMMSHNNGKPWVTLWQLGLQPGTAIAMALQGHRRGQAIAMMAGRFNGLVVEEIAVGVVHRLDGLIFAKIFKIRPQGATQEPHTANHH